MGPRGKPGRAAIDLDAEARDVVRRETAETYRRVCEFVALTPIATG